MERSDGEPGERPDAGAPAVGLVRVRDHSHQVVKRNEPVRREQLDGRVPMIFDRESNWLWHRGSDPQVAYRPGGVMIGSREADVVDRHKLSRWEGNDFAKPAGPVRATTALGRAAWTVDLAPRSDKPFPFTIVVDAETGVVPQQRNDGLG